MSEKIILSQGLQLLQGSPFKSSLANEFQSFTEDSNYSKAIEFAKTESELSETGKYLQSKDTTKQLYYNEIGSSILKKSDLISASLQNELSEDIDSSHLKIKLLAEHALAQLDSKEKLLSLGEIHILQQNIEQTILLRDEISKQLQENFKTLQKFTSNASHIEKDIDTINRIIYSNNDLNQQFDQISTDILNATKTLYNQYSLAFSFCYFEDLNIDIPSPSQPQNDKQTDELLSHIASVAVQRNVILPAPASTNSNDSNIEWAKSCLNSLLDQNYSNVNDKEIKSNSPNDEQELTSLRTALKDLQFAHQYLTRQYEDERNLNSTVMNTHKNKKAAIERQLAENLITLEKANQRSILVEHEKNVLERTLDDKMKDIYDLQKQVALLKIDNLGYIHTNNDSNSRIPSPEKSQISPVSPDENLSMSHEGHKDKNKYLSNPKTPLLQQSLNGSYRNASPSSPKFNNSISVLRNEFKKLVNEIHDSYKSEIEKEKIERKRLEHLLKLYEERNSDLEL
ncbi:Synaptonemal complex protein 1 [Wickerhamomyces ciferrii]|uniref:Synaptonemal complex protein 1 n=1 Tax=Wickerhamomyces ciferrii (strain ATCC 14091 / BCRC 22168 / CBS 111 / JCM 3599 / NBRC 0793 / NRRL Y-1031 F-60-10) TaxID=1206466 RepID=K0KJX3_WICCF|nr:Synaptonemal complex protein 1 [Wickerhamomyces ciferrii]CCH42457.1 Synaptonemal complex protein 1 [Wickerhamomyces ciferrii]